MEKINLTLIQRVAILWLKNVDRSLVIFKFLRDLSLPFRVLFYVGIIAFTTFGLIFASSFINFDDAPGAPIWHLLGNIIFYGTIAGMTLILTLESVYKLDVAQVLADIKQQKQDIKAQKLQRWRLFNMNIFMRIFIYISIAILVLFITKISLFAAFLDFYAANPNITNLQADEFKQSAQTVINEVGIVVILILSAVEYLTLKKRKARLEAQNESV